MKYFIIFYFFLNYFISSFEEQTQTQTQAPQKKITSEKLEIVADKILRDLSKEYFDWTRSIIFVNGIKVFKRFILIFG